MDGQKKYLMVKTWLPWQVVNREKNEIEMFPLLLLYTEIVIGSVLSCKF